MSNWKTGLLGAAFVVGFMGGMLLFLFILAGQLGPPWLWWTARGVLAAVILSTLGGLSYQMGLYLRRYWARFREELKRDGVWK